MNDQNISSWVYQLQGADGNDLNLDSIKSDPADLAVIDYSRDGSESGEFSAAEIQELQNSGKVVLGYIPIGAADAGRFYDANPGDSLDQPFSTSEGNSLQGPLNPNFPGTSFVKYWRQDWQDIIYGDNSLPGWVSNFSQSDDNYLERIQGADFNGVYLDDIDSYQQFDQYGDNSRPGAALEMLIFINELSAWAKARNPDFLVFAQNAENIFNDALNNLDSNGDGQLSVDDEFIIEENGSLYLDADPNNRGQDKVFLSQLDRNGDLSLSAEEIKAAYFESIDGLGSEDFFFQGDSEINNDFVDDPNTSSDRVNNFKFTAENYLEYAANDIPIFNVEYLSEDASDKLSQYQQITSDNYQFNNPSITTDGEAPAFSSEELDSLQITPFASPSRDLDSIPNNPVI